MEGPGITREALEKYLNRRVQELQEMKRCLDQHRYPDIVMLSHRIKGSAPTFGLENMGSLAEKLETSAEHSAQSEVTELLGDMEREINGALGRLGTSPAGEVQMSPASSEGTH